MSGNETITELAKRYANEIALTDVCREREERYRDLNDLKNVRPPVLIFEVPWGEIDHPDLKTHGGDTENLECYFRRALFQWEHFQGDHTYPPYFTVGAHVKNSGIGVSRKFTEEIHADSGSSTTSHRMLDQFPDEDSIEKLHEPEITYDENGTLEHCEQMKKLTGGEMPIRIGGTNIYSVPWDDIAYMHGPDKLLYDLYDRPEFMHALVKRFTELKAYEIKRYEELGVLETEMYYVHCTPGLVRSMPRKEIGKDKITAKDVWLRAAAQMFGSISPEMHDEFELEYSSTLADMCGLTYYGCCEPLNGRIENLGKRIKNLRRVTVTPWANTDKCAEEIGNKYVMSFKANPAFVAGKSFDPEPVIKEITAACEASRRNNTPFEIVLKDISTISRNYTNLEQWLSTVNSVLDKYY